MSQSITNCKKPPSIANLSIGAEAPVLICWRRGDLLAHLWVYGGLFIAAFLAATILPAQSAGLAALILASPASVILLVATASLGNVLGSALNWYLGRGINRFTSKRWFSANTQLSRATSWYSRYGRWSLLLSWVPVIGDPLTVVAASCANRSYDFCLSLG